MQIELKKDIEKEYKDEIIKGFSAGEVVVVAAAFALAAAIVYVLYKYFGVGISLGVYISVPCILPVLASGFLKIQGLTPVAYIKEIIYCRRTRVLAYDTDELPIPDRIKPMAYPKKKKGKKRCRQKK